MAVQNKFKVLREAEEVDQKWAKFKIKVAITEADVEHVPRKKIADEQGGFAEENGTTNGIYSLRTIIERALEV